MKYAITHEYAFHKPMIVSTHSTLAGAIARIVKAQRRFRRDNPSTFPTTAIFPLAVRELVNGEPGDRATIAEEP